MLGPAFGHGVREGGGAVFHQRHVLAFHPQFRQARAGEKAVEPALSVFGFVLQGCISRCPRQMSGTKQGLHEPVGHGRIHAYPEEAAVFRLSKGFHGPFELAFGVRGW